MPVHGIDDGNNKHEVYTTEELLSILQQAIDSGSLKAITIQILHFGAAQKQNLTSLLVLLPN